MTFPAKDLAIRDVFEKFTLESVFCLEMTIFRFLSSS